jgi:hypothetical protein
MLHRPSSGNGTRSSGYYTGTALLGPMGPGVGVLDTDVDPRSSDSPLGRPCSGAGGRRLPAPQQISPPSAAASQSSDQVPQSALMNELPGFFQAYGSGDSAALNGYAAPGTELTGLGRAVTFDSMAGLHVPPDGTTRQITVTVIWQVSRLGESSVTKLALTNSMSVVDLHSGKWYVNQISASTEAVGAK